MKEEEVLRKIYKKIKKYWKCQEFHVSIGISPTIGRKKGEGKWQTDLC